MATRALSMPPTRTRPGAPTPVGVARREQILDEAATLFSRRGYHAASMRELANVTGLLPGSLYAHFASKEDILFGVVQEAAHQFLGGMEVLMADRTSPPERLRKAMRSHVRVVAENLEGARVFHHEWNVLEGERRRKVVALRDRYEALWDRLIQDLDPPDPKFARLLVLSAANWTYTWYDPGGPLSPEEVADRFTDVVLDGVAGARKGRKNTRTRRTP